MGVGFASVTGENFKKCSPLAKIACSEPNARGSGRLSEAYTLLCHFPWHAREGFTGPRGRRALMPDQTLTDQEQLEHAVGQKIQKSSKRSSKRSLTRSQPLSLHKKSSASEGLTLADKQQQQLLLEHLQQVETLPKESRYARHRKACILKALSLLTSARCYTLSPQTCRKLCAWGLVSNL